MLCGKCGNNSCNGGRGIVDGKPCEACSESWLFELSEPKPEFSEEYKQSKRPSPEDKLLNKIFGEQKNLDSEAACKTV